MSTTTRTPTDPTRRSSRRRSRRPATARRRRTGSGLKLVAPAVILMLLVTAYPMLQALYLSLFRYRLTTPDDREFIGLSNYVTVLTDPLFWRTPGTPC